MEDGTDKDWITIKSGDPTTYPESGQTIIYTLSGRVTSGWGKRRRDRYANLPCIGRVVKEKGSYEFARVGGDAFKKGYVVPYDIAQWMPAPDVLRDLNVTPPMSPGVRYFLWFLAAFAILMPAYLLYQNAQSNLHISENTQSDQYTSEYIEDREHIENERNIVNSDEAKFLDSIDRSVKLSLLEHRVRNLSLEEALDVFLNPATTAEERLRIAPLVSIKFESYMKQRKDEGKERVSRKVYERVIKKIEDAKKLGIVEMLQEGARKQAESEIPRPRGPFGTRPPQEQINEWNKKIEERVTQLMQGKGASALNDTLGAATQ